MVTPRRAPRPPARTPGSASATRRNSARMGVAGSRPPPPPCGISGTPSNGVVTRRQTLTGIRTGIRTSAAISPAEASKRVPMRPKPEKSAAQNGRGNNTEEPIYGNIEPVKVKKAPPPPPTPPVRSVNSEKSHESLKTSRRSNTPRYEIS